MMRVGANRLLVLFTILLVLPCGLCALNDEADQAIRNAIKAAVMDGLNIVDSFLREEYWQFLKGAEIPLYNVTILTNVLNYKLIYLHKTEIFRANCNIDKATWKPFLNSLVRMPSFLADKINSTEYYDLFLLNNGIIDVTNPPKRADNNSTNNLPSPPTPNTTLQDLTSPSATVIQAITINSPPAANSQSN